MSYLDGITALGLRGIMRDSPRINLVFWQASNWVLHGFIPLIQYLLDCRHQFF